MLNDLSLAPEVCCLCREEWIFQQDNAAIHNASITKNYLLEQKKKRLFDYPVCSPGLDPIENLWGLIVAKDCEGGRQYSAISELNSAILDAVENTFGSTSEIIDSMPSRIFEVMKPNGGSTKYF